MSSPPRSSAKWRAEGDIVANYSTERKGLQLGYKYLSALIAYERSGYTQAGRIDMIKSSC